MYLTKGNQNNSTLEHQHSLSGLSLVESWLVEDEVHDKSRKYGMNVPVGTWMGAVKVNNDEVWNDYVKTGKVKGFSIEGYFADKMERPKESIKEDMSEKQADLLLSEIEKIVKGEKVELALDDELKNQGQKAQKIFNDGRRNAEGQLLSAAGEMQSAKKKLESLQKDIDKTYAKALSSAKELGVDLDKTTVGKNFKRSFNEVNDYVISSSTAISKIRKFKI